jgi:hypothetical protein
MSKAIQHLQKLSEDYAATKKIYEEDKKRGFKGIRAYFDPVYYDEKGHTEVLAAIKILTDHELNKKP